MMIVRQASYLIDWVIVGLIVIGGLFYFFGPRSLRTDEVIVVGLMILALIGFQIGLRRYGECSGTKSTRARCCGWTATNPSPPAPISPFKAPHETSGALSMTS